MTENQVKDATKELVEKQASALQWLEDVWKQEPRHDIHDNLNKRNK